MSRPSDESQAKTSLSSGCPLDAIRILASAYIRYLAKQRRVGALEPDSICPDCPQNRLDVSPSSIAVQRLTGADDHRPGEENAE
jgi:hypothetical protein